MPTDAPPRPADTDSAPPAPARAPTDADDAAADILAAYDAWWSGFAEVTGRARTRFLSRDWRGAAEDAAARLALYSGAVDAAVDALRGRIAPAEGEGDHPLKARYAAAVAGRTDAELARTFFNSVVRRVLGTAGVDARSEFTVDGRPPGRPPEPPVRVYPAEGLTAALFREILEDFRLGALADAETDAAECAALARAQLGAAADAVRTAEVLPHLFFRNKGAYVVGRLRMADGAVHPLLVPMENREDGIRPDAVLTDVDEVSIVFSFARSYFHAQVDTPAGTVGFLRSILPAKPVHELYTALGLNRHGKTELYRELRCRLSDPEARFEPIEGAKGLVMVAFVLPAANVVFKVIRDVFGASKGMSRRDVIARYRLVSRSDRVGRLIDAQEFEGLEFPRERFAPEVLDELLSEAANSVSLEGDVVRVRHLYTERRLRPLDVYVRENGDGDESRAAVLEYGAAIRDLACADIFPGDLLMKNFGVSRHGRVIFYDYDELALLTDVRFRAMPTARYEEQEMAAEPWFSVDERDVFPEEWVPFLVPPGPLRRAFMEAHGDLFTVRFWRDMQRRQEAGELPDFYPYPADRRLRHGRDETPHNTEVTEV